MQENFNTESSYFESNGKMMFQDNDGKIKQESFGLHLRVKMIVFANSSNDSEAII